MAEATTSETGSAPATAAAAATPAQEYSPSSETSKLITAWEHPKGEDAARTRSSIKPHWPQGYSGLTIGMGYDLKYHTADELRKDWGDALSPEQIQRLEAYTPTISTKGKQVPPKKRANKAAIVATKDIEVSYSEAVRVFEQKIQPKIESQAYKMFPGLETMDPYTQASVVSMVYNRGQSMGKKGTLRRKHFMEIKEAVVKRDTTAIAAAIRKMKVEHTHPKTKKGLHRRREAEALTIENNKTAVDAWYGKGPAVGAWP